MPVQWKYFSTNCFQGWNRWERKFTTGTLGLRLNTRFWHDRIFIGFILLHIFALTSLGIVGGFDWYWRSPELESETDASIVAGFSLDSSRLLETMSTGTILLLSRRERTLVYLRSFSLISLWSTILRQWRKYISTTILNTMYLGVAERCFKNTCFKRIYSYESLINVCDGETGVMGKRVVHFEIFNYCDNYATIRLSIHGFIINGSLCILLYLSISISESRADIPYLLNLFFFFHFWLEFPITTATLIITTYILSLFS